MSELSPNARALLEAASGGDEPSMADRARVRASMGARLAVGVAAGAAAATAVKSASAAASVGAGGAAGMSGAAAVTGVAVAGPIGVGTKLLLSLAVVSAIGAGTASYIDSTPRSASRAAPAEMATTTPTTARTAPVKAPAAVAKPSSVPESAIDVAPTIPTPAETALAVPTPTATHAAAAAAPATATATPAPASSVSAELTLLRDAHAALQSGNAARAVALLDEHARRFPAGALGEERDAARIFALCALGRASEARVASDRFLAGFPRSPHAARVRSSCGGTTSSATSN